MNLKSPKILIPVILLFASLLLIAYYFVLQNRLSSFLELSEYSGLSYLKRELSDNGTVTDLDLLKAQKITEKTAAKFYDDYFFFDSKGEIYEIYSEISLGESGKKTGATFLNLITKSTVNLLGLKLDIKAKPRTIDMSTVKLTETVTYECEHECGSCGKCDLDLGECVPDFKAAIAQMGSKNDGKLNHPFPRAIDGKYECIEYCSTDAGKACLHESWRIITRDNQMVCQSVMNAGDCRYNENLFAWKEVGDEIYIHWGSEVPLRKISNKESIYKDARGYIYSAGKRLTEDEDFSVCRKSSSRLAFVTSTAYTGDFVSEAKKLSGKKFRNGIEAADEICFQRARAGRLAGRWRAMLSDSNMDAKERLKPEASLAFPRSYKKITDGDIWDGNPKSFIDRDEFGNVQKTGRLVWTGTDASGTKQSPMSIIHCNDWSSSNGTGLVGLASSQVAEPYFNWISYGAGVDCSKPSALYCYEY